MSTPTHSDSSNDHLDNVLNVINQLAKKSAGGDYIYRGEPEHYDTVSSSLYRQYKEIDAKDFDIEVVQKEMLKEASRYTPQTDESEILAELQHYGGNTNLIDCTTDYFIALFFACNGAPDKDGRVVLLQRSDDENKRIWQPRSPNNRVIAQKSVFVQPKKGFVEPAEEIDVPRDLKEPILNHLRKFHGISAEIIYNDLHGFIKNQNIHQSAYTEFAWGLTYQNQGDNEKAIGHYDEVIKLKPDLAAAYYNRGNAYGEKGDYDRAIQNYDKAIDLKPDYAEAYNNRGLVYGAKGDHDRAIQDYDKAIDLNPDGAEAYYNRGNACGEKGDHDHAIEDYTKAIDLKPDLAAAYYNRGNAYGEKGDHDRAIEDYTKAIDLKPDLAAAYNNRGLAYGAKGDYDHAIEDYTKAIDLNPDDAKAYNNRGVAYGKRGDHDHAIQDYDKVIDLKPDDAKAYNNRGVAYEAKGNHDRAIQDYTKAIDLNPDLAEAYYMRGVKWSLLREWDKARSDLTAARRGLDIANLFFSTFGNISNFEQKYHVQLPDDIKEMLTP